MCNLEIKEKFVTDKVSVVSSGFWSYILNVSNAGCNIKPSFKIDVHLLQLSYKYGYLKPEMHCPCLKFLLHWFMYRSVLDCFLFKYSKFTNTKVKIFLLPWAFWKFISTLLVCPLGKYNLSGSLWTWCRYALNFRSQFEMFSVLQKQWRLYAIGWFLPVTEQFVIRCFPCTFLLCGTARFNKCFEL